MSPLCPDRRELGLRHQAAARSWLRIAKKHGDTPRGRRAAGEAAFHARMADHFFTRNQEVLNAR